MKPLSDRTHNLAQSKIRAVTHMINAVGGINLGQGICDLPTPEVIKAGTKRAIDEDQSIYSNYAGIAPLRTAILKKAQSFNHIPVHSEAEVMVSVGSTGAFVSAIFSLLDPGDEAILFEPFYGYHKNLIHLTGATPRYIAARGRDWTIDFEEVEQAINANTKVILVNTPGNPSGKVWTSEELQSILRIAEKHGLYIITDEIYEYMVYEDHKHISLASLPGAYERTITISGFSKTYNMTGWRVGYAVGPEPILSKMGLLNDLFFICAPTPLQHGVPEAFTLSESYYTQMQQDYVEKRRMMCEALESAGFSFSWPQGAYYVLAGFDNLVGKRPGFGSSQEACETLIHQAGVATVPGSASYHNPDTAPPSLRFCYAKEFPVLAQACEQIVKTWG